MKGLSFFLGEKVHLSLMHTINFDGLMVYIYYVVGFFNHIDCPFTFHIL